MLKKALLCALALMMASPAFAQDKNWDKRAGLRFGYGYLNGLREVEDLDSPGEAKRLSPHTFVLGFEMQQTMEGGEWLDILFIENITVSGLDQSVINPSVSVLVGFEIDKQIQIGVGPNVSAFEVGDVHRECSSGDVWRRTAAAPGTSWWASPGKEEGGAVCITEGVHLSTARRLLPGPGPSVLLLGLGVARTTRHGTAEPRRCDVSWAPLPQGPTTTFCALVM